MTDKQNSQERPRVLLLGNGINRLTQGNQSWGDMMEALEKPVVDFIDPNEKFTEQGKHILNVFRVQRAVNYQYGDKDAEQDAVEKWAAKLDKVARNGLHALLSRRKGLFQAILTTNYDHLVEKALGITCSELPPMPEASGNLFRRHTHEQTGVSVYHLHGEAGDTPSMLYSISHYLEEITRIVRFTESHPSGTDTPSWLDLFVNSELHICGLGFDFDELVLWYALQKRLDRYGYGMLGAYVYLTYEPEEKDSVEARASVFKSYGVRPVLVRVDSDANHEAAWKRILAEITLNIERIRLSRKSKKKKPLTEAEFAKLDEKKRKKLELAMKDFSLDRHGMNICSCNAVAYWNTERCVFRIPSANLDKAVASELDWYFDILINFYRATYVIPAKELRALISAMERAKDKDGRYSISVDFRSGAIYPDSEAIPDGRQGMKRLKKLPTNKLKSL